MKHLLCITFILLSCGGLLGQVRLDPADSSVQINWFRENPWSFMITSSILPYPSLNVGYKEMYDFLDGEGIEPDKDLDMINYGVQLRWRRILFDFVFAAGLSTNNEKLTVGGTRIYVDQQYTEFTFSLGYMVYSNRYISIIPRLGLGQSDYRLQYTRRGENATFDFNNPGAFQSAGSPELWHKSGYFHIGLEVLNGLQNDRRTYVFEGARIGYQRGWQDQLWDADQATLNTSLPDRAGQIYFSLVFGLSHGLKKRS